MKLKMRLFNAKCLQFFLLSTLFLVVSIGKIAAQNLSLDFANTPLRNVLKEITKQSGYNFAYSDALKIDQIKVTAKADNQDAKTFFDTFFKSIQINYRVNNKLISLTPATEDSEPISEIRGKVIDKNGQPISGVYVVVKGTKQNTVTDFDGTFAIGADSNSILQFSFIGYISESVSVQRKGDIGTIVMEEDVIALEETVVIGYGNTQKIKDLAGSISHLGTKEIQQSSLSANISSLLQGRAVGVNVQIQSSSPTSPVSVVVRGQTSLTGNNQPLWVIDGVPEYNNDVSGSISNVLFSLNLNDIESIDILKDASSTAIYGSRAANGVIVVTTKAGKKGMKPQIEVSTRWSMQNIDLNGFDYMNGPEYIAFMQAATRKEFMNRGSFDSQTRKFLDETAFKSLKTSEYNANNLIDLEDAYYYDSSTDWLNLMTQNSWNQQYDFSIRGGTSDVSYMASASYNDVNGIVKGSYNRIFSGRMRLEANIAKAFKFRINASGSSRNTSNKDGMLETIRRTRPDMPVYNEDGSYFTANANTENPYITLSNTNKTIGTNLSVTGELEWTIIKNLRFTTRGSLSHSNGENLAYEQRKTAQMSYDGRRTWTRPKSTTIVWDNTIAYALKSGNHDLSASLTASMEQYKYAYYGMTALNFPDDEILNSFTNATTLSSMVETTNANSLLSQIARAQYKWKEKYLLTATVRHDGSSKFGPGKRWGWFPSAGIGWIISNEKFMKNGWIGRNLNHLKIRASYGKAGSQNLSNYQWLSRVSSSKYNEQSSIYPSTIGNDKLHWETSYMTDISLEAEFWNSRIRTTIGIYQNDAEDLMYNYTLPYSTGFTSITSNIAGTRARGFEFSLEADIIKKGKWLLTLNANAARNKTTITNFNNFLEVYNPMYSQIEVGGEVGQWYGYKTAHRLFGSSEEVVALKKRSSTGGITNYRCSYEGAGDLYFLDLDGDGKVTYANDRTYLGSSVPKLFGGFGFQLFYGSNWNIGATFSYSWGNKRYWYTQSTEFANSSDYNQNNKTAGLSAIYNDPYNSKTMPNLTPLGDGTNGSSCSDAFLYDASYIRLNNLSISYRFDKRFFKKSFIDYIDITLQASNLFTLTRYPGFDPQGNYDSSNIYGGTTVLGNMGLDVSTYPAAQSYTLGLRFIFK